MLNSISYAALQHSTPSRTAKSLMLVLSSDLCHDHIPETDTAWQIWLFLLCMHSSAKINSLAYCLEYVSPLYCCMLSLAPFFLCIRLKLLVLPLEILFVVYPFCMPHAVRKLNLAASHPLLPVFIAYSFMFFKQESLCFSCDVLHGLRIPNICKIHSLRLSVKISLCVQLTRKKV